MTRRARRKVFYDCEFLEDGRTIDLISMAMADLDGNEYYAINNDMPINRIRRHRWLCENVVPYLPTVPLDEMTRPYDGYRPTDDMLSFDLDRKHPDVKSQVVIRDEVSDFLFGEPVELWALFGAYDHVKLAQLFGSMVNMPGHIPHKTNELTQRWEDAGFPPKPPKPDNLHDPRADVQWNIDLYLTCDEALKKKGIVLS